MRLALLGDLVRLSRAFGLGLLDEAHVLKQCQRRINHARAGRILAVRDAFDRADQIIAVAWAALVGDQEQQQQPKLAAFEHPPPPSPAVASAAAPTLVTEVEAERAPIALPAATSTHRHQCLGQADLDPPARAAAVIPVSHVSLPFRWVADIS